MFFLLSTMTALLECGTIFIGMHQGYTPGCILSLCLAYQFGNLFPIPFSLNKQTIILLISITTTLLFVAPFTYNYPFFQWILYFLGIMLLSACMQSIRILYKGDYSTFKKRIARVIGFLSSPLMFYFPYTLLLTFGFIILFCTIRKPSNKMSKSNTLKFNLIIFKNSNYRIMLWHQLHYFSYTYIMLLTVYNITHNFFFTVFGFAFSWLTYLFTEPLLTRKFKSLTQDNDFNFTFIHVILGGHMVLLFILLLLPNVPDWVLIVLWVFTGFGGGTVFAITSLCKHSTNYQKEHLDLTENTGHFGGTAISVIWAFLFPNNILNITYISSICVVFVLILTFKTKQIKKEHL